MLTSDVISHFGSGAKVAEALNVGRAAVSKWQKKGVVPPLRAAQLHKLTRGKLIFDLSKYTDWYKKTLPPA
jgi:hypothetical protein